MSVTHVPADLRRLVRERAGERCEYCLIPEALALATHTIDHVIHFRLAGGRIEPLTATGRVTVRLLQLNHPDRVVEREMLVAAGILNSPST